MSLSAGEKLGHYEILSPIGKGGMGEVWRARDPRLNRDVAIKTSLIGFSGRFQKEAHAIAALNHPNICTLYDVGPDYLVMEYVPGETLTGPVPVDEALKIAAQVAQALEAAHEKGITHRDLKPANIRITNDGVVKVLDFGLARMSTADSIDQDNSPTMLSMPTQPGTILGTAAYMAPEQARGKVVDKRADIWAFGVVLYEIITGKRLFEGETVTDILAGVLTKEPDLNLVPVKFRRLLERCLEKDPRNRLRDIGDWKMLLEEGRAEAPVPTSTKTRPTVWIAAAALLAVALAAMAFLHFREKPPAAPVMHALTHRRGTVFSARFTPDGQNIVYDAAWDGRAPELFSSARNAPEGRPLGLTETALLSLSPKGEMAVIPHAPQGQHISFHGTLATAPLAGGAPREIAEDIEAADWAPHGSGLLLVRVAGGKRRLEFPAGRVLVETEGWISHPRFSPDGDRIAYLDHPVLGDDLGSVVMIDLAGKKSTLSAGWEGAEGLAWSPDGKEVWFTASKVAGELSLYAVGRSGRERSVLASPVGLLLYDISRDGAILLGRYEDRVAAFAGAQGEARERDLSWLDATMVRDISQDGKTILLTDFSAQSDYGVGLRKTDGSPVVSLGHGSAIALSPDGKLALTVSAFAPQKWSVVPTGAGDSHSLPMEGLTNFQSDGAWLPDSRRLIVVGAAAGQKMRTWLTDVAGVKPRPITPEGITGTLLSPDGRSLAAGGTDGKLSLYPMEGGEPAAVQGLKDGDQAIRWSSDGRSLYVVERGAGPTRIIRLEIATGKRELWKEITPADPAGLRPGSLSTVITPDGKSWAYTTMRILSRLYLVEGLK